VNNVTVLYKVSIYKCRISLFLYSIFNFNSPKGTVILSSFPRQYYQSITILTIFYPNYTNKNIFLLIIRFLIDIKRATNARDIDNDSYSIFRWGGLIYSFSRGTRLNLALVVI
jgi:hypothetical protein